MLRHSRSGEGWHRPPWNSREPRSNRARGVPRFPVIVRSAGRPDSANAAAPFLRAGSARSSRARHPARLGGPLTERIVSPAPFARFHSLRVIVAGNLLGEYNRTDPQSQLFCRSIRRVGASSTCHLLEEPQPIRYILCPRRLAVAAGRHADGRAVGGNHRGTVVDVSGNALPDVRITATGFGVEVCMVPESISSQPGGSHAEVEPSPRRARKPLMARSRWAWDMDPSHRQPRVINTDQAPLYGSAISGVKQEGILRRRCHHRPVQYLNNILEQDHRAIKRRVKAKQGFREFHAARRTIQGYEAMHMIRKGQARWVSGSDVRQQIQFINQLFEVAA